MPCFPTDRSYRPSWAEFFILGACVAFFACANGSLQNPKAPDQTSNRFLIDVPFFPDKTDQCGPATLAGLLSFWGKPTDPAQLRKEMYLAQLHGTLPMDLLLTAQTHGLKADMVRGDLNLLHTELFAGRPVLAMLNGGYTIMPVDHYVIVTGFNVKPKGLFIHSAGKKNQFISDKEFLRQWEKTDYWVMVTRLP